MTFLKAHPFLIGFLILSGILLVGFFWYKHYINSIIGMPYTVIEKTQQYEIRSYQPFLVAETIINEDSFRRGGNSAFGILAGYIFGGNTAKTQIPMTSPVLEETISEPIPMTSPVLDTLNTDNTRTFAFVLPDTYTMDTLPTPNDERVILREVPAKTVAVRQFSGFWNQKNFDKNYEILTSSLTKDKLEFSDTYTRASYDPPMVPFFIRRNEIHIEIK